MYNICTYLIHSAGSVVKTFYYLVFIGFFNPTSPEHRVPVRAGAWGRLDVNSPAPLGLPGVPQAASGSKGRMAPIDPAAAGRAVWPDTPHLGLTAGQNGDANAATSTASPGKMGHRNGRATTISCCVLLTHATGTIRVPSGSRRGQPVAPRRQSSPFTANLDDVDGIVRLCMRPRMLVDFPLSALQRPWQLAAWGGPKTPRSSRPPHRGRWAAQRQALRVGKYPSCDGRHNAGAPRYKCGTPHATAQRPKIFGSERQSFSRSIRRVAESRSIARTIPGTDRGRR